MKVKEEPPEEFVIVLPSPDDDPTAQSEDDDKPLADVKEEPQEDSLLVPLSPPKDQSQQARLRQSTRKRSNARFTIKKDLRKPSRPKTIHSCVDCDVKFSSKPFLDRHLNEYHGVEFKCDKCSFHTTNSILLKSHKGTHSKPLVCSTCQQPYATNSAMRKHQRTRRHGTYENAPVVAYICDICDKSFATSSNLKTHENDVHDENEVKCEVCGKICRNRTLFRAHSRTHTKVECPVCLQRFTKYLMAQHLKTHSNKPYECDLCGHSANQKENIRRHIEAMHLRKKFVRDPKEVLGELLNGKEFKCEKCPFQTTTRNLLTNHRWIHRKPFTCETCQKPYFTKKSMNKHQRQQLHGTYENAPVVAYICDICNKSFSSPNYLRQHKNDTHDEKKVTCEVCGKICKNRKSFRDHSRTHIKDECPVCLIKVSKDKRAEHIQTHSTDKPFKCDLCHYSAKMIGNIRRHVDAMHFRRKLSSDPERSVDSTSFRRPDHSLINAQEKFALVLPPSADNDEDKPQAEAQEEFEEDSLLELLPMTDDQTLQATNDPNQQPAQKHCCTKCGQVFDTKSGLRWHTNSEMIHKCIACDAPFSCKLLRDRHQSDFHDAVLKCGKCSYQTIHMEHFKSHKATHDKQFACETCKQKFATSHLLKLHQLQHKHGIYANAPEVTFNCDECNKSFSSPKYLKNHQKKVHEDDKVKCEVCDKIYKNQFNLRSHRRSHIKVECSICKKIFSASKIAIHLRKHHKSSRVRSFKQNKSELEKLQTGVNERSKPNQLRAVPPPEEVVDHKFAQAQKEPSTEPKRWVKSVELPKVNAKWRIKSKLFQTYFACPHCQLVVNYQKHLTQHLKACSKKNQTDMLKRPCEQIII